MSAAASAAEAARELDGLAIVQRMLTGEIAQAPICQTLDYQLISVERGRAVFEGFPGPAHLNPHHTVHGGWIATLLDSAMGSAVRSSLPAGRVYTTSDLKLTFIRALLPGTGRVLAEGEVLHRGGRLAAATGLLRGEDGTVYAHASATCLVLPAAAPAPAPSSP